MLTRNRGPLWKMGSKQSKKQLISPFHCKISNLRSGVELLKPLHEPSALETLIQDQDPVTSAPCTWINTNFLRIGCSSCFTATFFALTRQLAFSPRMMDNAEQSSHGHVPLHVSHVSTLMAALGRPVILCHRPQGLSASQTSNNMRLLRRLGCHWSRRSRRNSRARGSSGSGSGSSSRQSHLCVRLLGR